MTRRRRPYGAASLVAGTVQAQFIPLEVLRRSSGGGWGDALRLWNDRRKNLVLPEFEVHDAMVLRALLGWSHLVDTSADEPGNFRYRLFGSNVAAQFRMPNMTGMRIGDAPWKAMRDNVEACYFQATSSLEPIAQHIRGDLGSGIRGAYTRVLLPFNQRKGRASRLLVGIFPTR